VKHLDGIPDEKIAGLQIPNGVPLVNESGPEPRSGTFVSRIKPFGPDVRPGRCGA